MAKEMKLERCRERPPCGAAVVDRAEHRRWHAEVVRAPAPFPVSRPSGPRYVGVDPDPDPLPAPSPSERVELDPDPAPAHGVGEAL